MEEFKPQKIEEGMTHGAIAFNSFQLNDDPSSFYLIEIENKLEFNQMISLLKDSDIFTEEDGIFTWIIGTQLNNNLTSNGPPTSCNPSDLHLWSKKVSSIQEIRTKHIDIILSSLSNKNIISSRDADQDDIKDALYDGVIDYILYAGELRKKTIRQNGMEYCSLTINFLSGTFMDGVVDAENPSEYTKRCIENIFTNIAREDQIDLNVNVQFDTSVKTFINDEYKMTRPLLEEFMHRGAKVYKFSNKADMLAVKNKAMNIVRLEGILPMYQRMKNDDLIQDTLNKINNLNSINIENYRFELKPVRYGGTRKKNRRKNGKTKSMRRRNKTIRKKTKTNKRFKNRKNKK
jgi:hypothetical protein